MTIYFKDGTKTEAKTIRFHDAYICYTKTEGTKYPPIEYARPINTIKTIHAYGILMEAYEL